MSANKAMNVQERVQALQGKLYRAAKQTLDRKFGALYDKIYRRDVLWMAWKRVRAKKGAPGLDNKTFNYIEKELGIGNFMKEIQMELQEKRYRPTTVKRVWIPKPGRSEKRPLGIPTIKDRIVQMATKIVIEPIFEANFLECSYGFRPKRSAHMAMKAIRNSITFNKEVFVIDADIKGFFDNIRHDILLNQVQRRISDPRIIRLIKGWLKTGVLDKGKYEKPDGLGTPQGGVISPLLANIYLHSFDKMFEQSGIKGTLVRYADDVVILVKSKALSVLRKVERMFNRLSLKLHKEKTKVVFANKGFDFLGVHFRRVSSKRKESRLKYYCRLWPSNKSLKALKQKVIKRIGRRYSKSLKGQITQLNPILRGWCRANIYDRKKCQYYDRKIFPEF